MNNEFAIVTGSIVLVLLTLIICCAADSLRDTAAIQALVEKGGKSD